MDHKIVDAPLKNVKISAKQAHLWPTGADKSDDMMITDGGCGQCVLVINFSTFVELVQFNTWQKNDKVYSLFNIFTSVVTYNLQAKKE